MSYYSGNRSTYWGNADMGPGCAQQCGVPRKCNRCNYGPTPNGRGCMKTLGPTHRMHAGMPPVDPIPHKPCQPGWVRKRDAAPPGYGGAMPNPWQCIKEDGDVFRRLNGLPPRPKQEYVPRDGCGQPMPEPLPTCASTGMCGVSGYNNVSHQHGQNGAPGYNNGVPGGWY